MIYDETINDDVGQIFIKIKPTFRELGVVKLKSK